MTLVVINGEVNAARLVCRARAVEAAARTAANSDPMCHGSHKAAGIETHGV